MVKKLIIRIFKSCISIICRFGDGIGKTNQTEIKFLKNSPYHIVLVAPFGIGNVLMISPILKLLKETYPHCSISVIGEKTSLEIIKYNPYWDNMHFLSKHAIDNIKLFATVSCDILMCGYPGSSFRMAFYSIFSSSKYRIAYEYPIIGGYSSFLFTHTMPRIKKHFVDMNVDLLKFQKINSSVDERKPKYYFYKSNDNYEKEFLETHSLTNEKIVGMQAGSASEGGGKRWPFSRFREVAKELTKKGYKIILFVGPDEKEIVCETNGMQCDCIILIDNTLDQVAHILKVCDFTISNDSSLMHIAAAVGTPSVGIYGPTNPSLSSPYCSTHEAVVANFECSPCYTADKSLSCKIGYKCMKTISVQDVLQAVERLQKRIGQTK